MAATKLHKSILTKELKEDIDLVLNKLKSTLTRRQVQNWLENFKESEVELALNFLLFFEYITFAELQSRFEPFIKDIAALAKDNNVLFVPYGNYVKSNDLIMYSINKSEIFTRLYNRKKFHYTRDLLGLNLEAPTILAFIDDFIGSGNSFIKWYRHRELQQWLARNDNQIIDQYLLCSEVMITGKGNIENLFSNIKVLGHFKNKIFDQNTSPFKKINVLNEMQDLCLRYGGNIPVAFSGTTVYAPLGYDDSEALLAFDYGTPNNTLAIIWGSKNWQPIFPRVGKQRITMIEQVKKDALQFAGIIRKLGFTIDDDLEIQIGKKPMLFRSQEDLGLLAFLLLKQMGSSDAEISQDIGVQIQILNKIIRYGKQQHLINTDNNLTPKGAKFIKAIRAKAYKFRENDELNDKSKSLFVPLSFNNTT